MVRRLFLPGRLVLLLALAGVAAVVAGGLLPAVAHADQKCWSQATRGPNGGIVYVWTCENVTPGQPGGPGGGGSGPAPDCGLEKMSPMTGYGSFFCVGKAPCTIKDNWVPYAPPTEEAPEGKEWKLRLCWPCGGCLGPPVPTYVLDGPPARPLIVQAQEAFGRLRPPAGVVRHDPVVQGIVGLETWFWLDPGSFGEVLGTSAEGLIAVAEPDGTTWATGDGATVSCAKAGVPYAEGGSSDCTHTYRRASARYDGNVTRRWVVHYEQGGNAIDIPGAPATLAADTPWALSVAEAQVVTGERPGR